MTLPNSYVLDFDRSPDSRGTDEQRATIRGTVTEHAVWGSPLNRVMHGLAVLVKYHSRRITISFRPDVPFGTANQLSITLNSGIVGPQLVGGFWHELGHVIGMNFWSDGSEGWAHLFGGWIGAGAPVDMVEDDGSKSVHAAWARLRDALDSYNFDMSPPVT